MKRLTSIRLPELTDRQLTELASVTGLNATELITTAIDRMYREELKTMYTFSDLQSVLRRIPAGNPFYPYKGDSVVAIKNEDGSISVTDNGEEANFVSIADATEHIDNLRDADLNLTSVDEYV